MQIWAVDVSAYSLWTSDSKGDEIIKGCLGDNHDEQSKVKRYLREIDQIRKALIRLIVLSRCKSLSLKHIIFSTTKEGKPYLSSPMLDFDFNITHDGDWVIVAFQGTMQARISPSTSRIGVDVMEIHLPHYEKSVQDFVETMDMTLTKRERDWILSKDAKYIFKTTSGPPDDMEEEEYNQLKKLYTLWTYKEAYTKARGIGLGYDFQKIDVKIVEDRLELTVDGRKEQHIDTIQITLPCGQSQSEKVGAGRGMHSLLVAMQLGFQSDSMLLTSITAKQAQEKGFLRLWSMDELIDALLDVISKKV